MPEHETVADLCDAEDRARAVWLIGFALRHRDSIPASPAAIKAIGTLRVRDLDSIPTDELVAAALALTEGLDPDVS